MFNETVRAYGYGSACGIEPVRQIDGWILKMDPTWTSLLPAAVAIVLAFATRRVVPALFAAVVTGGIVLYSQTGDASDANFVRRFLLPALGSGSYAKILVIYLWSLGGLIGVWEKTGGAQHFAKVVGGRVAKGPRSAKLFGWMVGVIFHQGGTVSTVLAGTTVKPVTDKHGIAHEELAYIVDSTASPVATVLPFNAWPAYVAALVVGTVPVIPDLGEAVSFFFGSVIYNFYGIIAVTMTFLFAMGWLPWVGKRMAAAQRRVAETGALDGPGAEPMMPPDGPAEPAAGYTPSLADFFVPIGVLLGVGVLPTVLWDANWIDEAFVSCALSAMVVARVRGLSLGEVMDGFINGCRAMTIGAVILGLAVTLAKVTAELDTASYLVSLMSGAVPVVALPALLMVLCMGIAFACGSSWGTYAVVFPVAMPLAWAMAPDITYLHLCFGAVLGGSVFGDQCSPISDTTILSSMFTGCDLMDHVQTQLPLALSAAGLGAALATVIASIVV
jgi:Na+/H+ antiporter NhaC